ncbi:MAG: hypothetical protein AB7F19_06930 [Candidatus Babeliales bacterium]
MAVGHLFWGSLLILAGASLVLDNVFYIILPVMKWVLAIVLVYKGLALIFEPRKPHYHMHE